jgi:hypothetical protein
MKMRGKNTQTRTKRVKELLSFSTICLLSASASCSVAACCTPLESPAAFSFEEGIFPSNETYFIEGNIKNYASRK